MAYIYIGVLSDKIHTYALLLLLLFTILFNFFKYNFSKITIVQKKSIYSYVHICAYMKITTTLQAKIILYLDQLPLIKRNAYNLAAKLGKSLSHTLNTIKVLEAGDVIKKVGEGKGKKHYMVTSVVYVDQAKEVLTKDVFQNEIVAPSD